MIAERRFLRAAAGRKHVEKVVLEEKHLVRAWRQRLDSRAAHRRRRKNRRVRRRRGNERACHVLLDRIAAEGAGECHLKREAVPVPPQRGVCRVL